MHNYTHTMNNAETQLSSYEQAVKIKCFCGASFYKKNLQHHLSSKKHNQFVKTRWWCDKIKVSTDYLKQLEGECEISLPEDEKNREC